MTEVGRSVLRVEDLPLITGRARYVADVRRTGCLSAMIVRSPVAHGRIVEIDASEALASEGVVAVLDAGDVLADLGEIPNIWPRVSFDEAVVPFLQPVIAHGKVRFVGEPIAVVIAQDRYAAEDSAELVFADIDPLDAVMDLRMADEAEPLFDRGNVVTTLEGGFGDPENVFADADVVVESSFDIGRHSAVPMETRGLLVEHDASGSLVVHGATKVPHSNRSQLAKHLGIGPEKIRMLETSVGGGFGVRGEYYPEDFLIAWAARRLGATVSWIEDRREHFMAANQSRQQEHDAALAGTSDGRILGLKSEFWADMGAYVRTHGIRVPDLTLSMLPGPYDIGAYQARAHCVLSNRTPTATYRAPGRFESCFVRERLIDMYAARVGIDPTEVRRRNLITPEQIPYRRNLASTGEAVTFNEGDYPALLEKVDKLIDREEVQRRRSDGELVGYGIAVFLEKSGLGPWESGAATMETDGTVTVRSGCSSVGQGLRTVLAQIVADVFQVGIDKVRVELLDTDKTSYGTGSYASRSTATAGSAVHLAATKVLERAKTLASEDLEVDPADLVVRSGGLEVTGSPDLRLEFAQIARELEPPGAVARGVEPGLRAEAFFDVQRVTYPYGAHAAIVSVDAETGSVQVERLILGYDIGLAVNPMLVDGQLHGGALQGLAGALLEHFEFDEAGNPLVTSFMDYLMPTLSEAPVMETVVTEDAPTRTNPLGVKGAGEGGLTGVAAAIAAAVDHALGSPGSITSVPISPQRIREASG